MGLNFKSPEVERLARVLASCTGETLTEAVRKALEDRLRRERRAREDPAKLKADLMAIGKRCSELPVLNDRSPDEILGYDEHGLPT